MEIGVLVDEYVFKLKFKGGHIACQGAESEKRMEFGKRVWEVVRGRLEIVGLSHIIKDCVCHPGGLAVFS